MKVVRFLIVASLVIAHTLSASLRPVSDDTQEADVETVSANDGGHDHKTKNPLKPAGHAHQQQGGASTAPRTQDPEEVALRRRRREAFSKSPMAQLSVNCREVLLSDVESATACNSLTLTDIVKRVAGGGAGSAGPYDTRMNKETGDRAAVPLPSTPSTPPKPAAYDASQITGLCRYDPYRAKIDPKSACICVATRETCNKNRDTCFWQETAASKFGECISNTERVYNHLAGLLKKRGKTDLDINIKYGSVGAPGQLPYGPGGPAIIGDGYKSFTAANPELALAAAGYSPQPGLMTANYITPALGNQGFGLGPMVSGYGVDQVNSGVAAGLANSGYGVGSSGLGYGSGLVDAGYGPGSFNTGYGAGSVNYGGYGVGAVDAGYRLAPLNYGLGSGPLASSGYGSGPVSLSSYQQGVQSSAMPTALSGGYSADTWLGAGGPGGVAGLYQGSGVVSDYSGFGWPLANNVGPYPSSLSGPVFNYNPNPTVAQTLNLYPQSSPVWY